MTTVVFKNGHMVGDTLCVSGNFKMKCTKKVAKTDKYLIGMSGNAAMFDPFVDFVSNLNLPINEAFKTWKELPDFGGFSAIIVDREYNIWTVSASQPPILVESVPYYAIGSGADYALGAMEMGATAWKAVQVAALFDPNTDNDTVAVGFNLDKVLTSV